MNLKGKMNGMSLFAGTAGIDLALDEWVTPLLYCEIEPYPQAIILSRMDDGSIPFAPIWNDVTTINGELFKGLVDIVYGGFPCQDISSAGLGKGLDGERSGLFFEVVRICKEASPQFIFLENVAAIRTRGSIEIQETLAGLGYDCRFGMLSAAEIGACHGRDRWFCLAARREVTSNSFSIGTQVQVEGQFTAIKLPRSNGQNGKAFANSKIGNDRIDLSSEGLGQVQQPGVGTVERVTEREWPTESPICRADDVPTSRMDRIKACGNGVVPFQVETAFKVLMGISAR